MRLIIDIDEELYEAYKGKPPMLGDAGMDMIAQAIANGTPYNPSGDLISRSALLKAMEEERQYLLARGQTGAEHIIVHHCLPIIDNAPTVERPQGEIVIKCQDCKYQVKEWREDRRMKEKGYWVYGCNHFGDIMGYWGFGGNDNEFCSDAEQKGGAE